MARFGKDTRVFPLSVWVRHGQHLATVPKMLADKVRDGESVKGKFELRLEGDKLKLVLERE